MKLFYWAVPAVLVLTPFGVSAAFQVYTDKNAFLLGAGPTVTTENFETAPLGTVPSGATPKFGTLEFSYLGSPDGGLGDPFLGQPLIKNFGDINGSREFMGEVNADGTPSGIHTFKFPDPVFAFGGTFNGAVTGAYLTVTAADGTLNLSDYLGYPGSGFFGFTSTKEFSSLSFGTQKTSGSEVFRLDDVVYASKVEETVPPVPLSNSFWFLLAGLGALLISRSRTPAMARISTKKP